MSSSPPRIPPFLVLLIVVIAVANGLANKYYWYWQMRWFDIPMHFAGGVWLAGMAFWWFYTREGAVNIKFSKILSTCLMAALGVGLVWEIYEAIVGVLTVAGYVNPIADTLKDLFFDTIGGTTVAVWGYWRMKKLIK